MEAELREVVREAARIVDRGSKLAYSYFRHPLLIEIKENDTPVTIADKKTEEIIREELARTFPDHGIIGEEFGEESEGKEFVWTVDPIDGTRSFIRGIPLWGTLLALLHRGEPIVGVMALPCLQEIYWAAKGIGAHCNGHAIHVSNTQVLESALVSFADYPTFEDAGKKAFVDRMMKKAELARGYTDCFSHSLVMRGGLDAMVDPIVSIWDVAPLACLVREAGGDYCNFQGERTIEDTNFISFCTPELKEELLKL